MKIIISGSRQEMNDIFWELKILTDDELGINWETGEVYIIRSAQDNFLAHGGEFLKKTSGTALVSYLIQNKKHTATIVYEKGQNSTKYLDGEMEAQIPGAGSSSLVKIDIYNEADTWETDPATGNIYETKAPIFITLAHELIHAERGMRGNSYGKSATNEFQFKDRNGVSWIEKSPIDEQETAGVASPRGYTGIDENDIRAEHGLRRRGAYNGTNGTYGRDYWRAN